MIDWRSTESHWMVPPKMASREKKWTEECRDRLKWIEGYVWISSSGTTRVTGVKWIGLGKHAFLASAAAVNRHLGLGKKDIWLNVLPTYHVGGLSMFARADLACGKIFDLSKTKWNVDAFAREVRQRRATVTSLVPAQVFDIFKAALRAPDSLRAVVIGGGALDMTLYEECRALGWPLRPSYGMTECCSQVATADGESPNLRPLSHVRLEVRGGRLAIRSKALASFIAHCDDRGFTLEDPRRDGWLLSEDFVELDEHGLRPLGRAQEQVKILGELVALPHVEAELKEHGLEASILSFRDERKGAGLVAVFERPKTYREIVQGIAKFHAGASPLWRLDGFYCVDSFPRSPLGKVLKARLVADLGLPS